MQIQDRRNYATDYKDSKRQALFVWLLEDLYRRCFSGVIKNKNHNCKTAKEEQETKAELTSSLCADGKEYGVAKGEEGAKQGQLKGVEMEAGISAGSEKGE